MAFTEPSAMERLQYMQDAKNVAIVGASDNPARASYFVATYLLSASHFKLFFVNPRLDEILGQKVYKSLADIEEPIDIVDVFRKASDIPGVLDEAIAIKAKTFWMQLGISDDASAARGVAAGLNVVQDKCLKIEHARFAGGLNLAGFNTGVISSKRNKSI
jgi:predicted CoA-binding protein